MQTNVAQQLKAPIGATRNYEVDEIIDFTGDSYGHRVQGEVSLVRTHRGILLQGTLHTKTEVTCSRCLTRFTYPLTLKIEEEYMPKIDVITGIPSPPPDDPDAFTIDEHHILDLTEATRQHVLLAIPMKPLCYEDCAGLCPHCGHNLNDGPCDCPSETVDPHRSKLTKLL